MEEQIKSLWSQLDSARKKLDTPKSYTFDPDQFENIDEAKTAGAWPNEGQILAGINKTKSNSAKSQAYQNATKDLREAYEQTDDYKRKTLVAALVQAGKSQADAEAFADTVLAAK